MEAIASHDFNATASDELPFRQGQKLIVMNMEDDPNWYTAFSDYGIGVVPCNYIRMRNHSWYVPNCSRTEAENRLSERDPKTNKFIQPDGAFIVRKSNNGDGFSLSVKVPDSAIHFKILQDERRKFFIWVEKFYSINSLIDYHKNVSISRSSDILLADRKPSWIFADGDKLETLRVIAHYDFTASSEDELSFKRGDVINVEKEVDANWWFGRLNGKEGLFPSNYVEVLPSANR